MKKFTKFYLTSALCSFAFLSIVQAKEVLAKINGKREITSEQVDKQVQALPADVVAKNTDPAKLRKQVLDQLIDVNVLIEAALESGVDKKPEVQEAIQGSRDQVVAQAFIFDQLKSKVNDQEIQNKYKELKDKFPKDKKERKVRHILVKDEKEANSIIEKLKGGQDFQKLAREMSVDRESAKEGGDLGYYIEGTFVPEFEKAANDLQPGKYTLSPVKTQFGFHIIKLEDTRAAKPPKFDDIKQQLGALVQQEAMMTLIKKLRDKSKVEIMNESKSEIKSVAKDQPKVKPTA